MERLKYFVVNNVEDLKRYLSKKDNGAFIEGYLDFSSVENLEINCEITKESINQAFPEPGLLEFNVSLNCNNLAINGKGKFQAHLKAQGDLSGSREVIDCGDVKVAGVVDLPNTIIVSQYTKLEGKGEQTSKVKAIVARELIANNLNCDMVLATNAYLKGKNNIGIDRIFGIFKACADRENINETTLKASDKRLRDEVYGIENSELSEGNFLKTVRVNDSLPEAEKDPLSDERFGYVNYLSINGVPIEARGLKTNDISIQYDSMANERSGKAILDNVESNGLEIMGWDIPIEVTLKDCIITANNIKISRGIQVNGLETLKEPKPDAPKPPRPFQPNR